jgi:rhodanese-related sulfurtransferase
MKYGRALIILAAVLLALAALGCSANEPAESITYVTVDVEETFEQLNANDEAQIVDVREPNEWATTGVPPGAVLIPLGQLEQRAPQELVKDKPVYVICNSGNRSRTGASILIKLGYAEVYNVDGGIQAWLREGLPVESYKP